MTAPTRSSPAVVITCGAGLLSLPVALARDAFPIALFLAAVALAALPLALGDRPGARLVRFALLGAGSAVLSLVLVLVPLLVGDEARAGREADPVRVDDVPQLPESRPSPS